MTDGEAFEARPDGGVAIDLGGTKIASGSVDRPDEVFRMPTPDDGRPETVIDALVLAARHWGARPGRVVLATAGDLDRARGVIRYAANLPFHDAPVVAQLSDRLGCPVTLVGDATAATLAELGASGEGGAIRNGLYVTVSTGVGMGAVRDGRIDWTLGFGETEIGHRCVDRSAEAMPCGCGKTGCLEVYASGGAIARRYMRAIEERGNAPSDHVWWAGDVVALVGRDPAATRIVGEARDLLVDAITELVRELDAEVVVLGGGVVTRAAASGPDFFDMVRSGIEERCAGTVVRRAVYGDHSALRGALRLCAESPDVVALMGDGGMR